ncbi:MAG: DUF1311 domain-containing protein [Sphingomonadaceae bacterium]|nr:DUF1311 domain-containing protein [Sphingomonadaceae bacterium]
MNLLFPLLLLAAQPQDPPWNCDDPQVQQEMNWCAAREYERADAALNAQWPITAAEMKRRDEQNDWPYDERPGYFETLLKAQRAWIEYRDAHCQSEGYWARGGPLEPLLVSTCKTRLTEERTEQLQFLVEQ